MALVPYATYSDFTACYSLKGVSEAEISSYWLFHGTMRVNERLGAFYTLPFSSNIPTIKDLSIQFAYLGVLVRTRKETDSKELKEELDQRILDITSGGGSLFLDDGSTEVPKGGSADNAGTSWSDQMDYKPTFDMRDPLDQRIDPDLIQDLYDTDY